MSGVVISYLWTAAAFISSSPSPGEQLAGTAPVLREPPGIIFQASHTGAGDLWENGTVG